MPGSSQGVKRRRHGRGMGAGLRPDATAGEQDGANGNNAEGVIDKAPFKNRAGENEAAALQRLQIAAINLGDRAFNVAGWKTIAKSQDTSKTPWKFAPPKEWADANGIDVTCALTQLDVRKIVARRAKEGQSGCNTVHAAANESNADIEESVAMTKAQEAAQPQEGPDHLTRQLEAAKKILTQQCSEHAAEQTRLRTRAEVLMGQLKEQTQYLASQAARTKERAAAEEQQRLNFEDHKSQLQQQNAEQTARAETLRAALEAAEEKSSVKVEDLQRQLEQQAGSTADQTARAEALEAALEAIEDKGSEKPEDLQRQLEQQAGRSADQTARTRDLQAALEDTMEQWSVKVEDLQSQLELQAGMTAHQTARAEALEAAAQDNATQASCNLSDSHILLRAASIVQMDPSLKQALLTVINM